MAKKSAGKVVQMLSPENYIRKKARALPLLECLVNDDWKEQGVAHIVVARSHTNGNITMCMYLIDLFCLGVKNTQYLFNITKTEYQEKKESIDSLVFEQISYELAHNIVFAGLEYAEEYGFKPHKDFTSITQYMLEEDTDEIELIEVECGKDGKPFYVNGPYEDQTKIKQILAQLERTAEPGNYDFEIVDDNEFADDNPEGSELERLTFAQKRDLFFQLYNNKENLNEDQIDQFEYLTDYCIENMIDPELVNKYTQEYLDDFDFELTEEVSSELLGIPEELIQPETGKLFMDIYASASDSQRAEKLLEKFKNETPKNPAACFLEAIILREKNQESYTEKVNEYSARYPEYPLFKIFAADCIVSNAESLVSLDDFTMHQVFAGRTTVNTIEAFNYLTIALIDLLKEGDIDRLEGFYNAFSNLELPDSDLQLLDNMVFFIQTEFVSQILKP